MLAAAWIGVGALVYSTDPENLKNLILPGGYLLFTSLFSIAVFLLLTIIFMSTKRALWWTIGIIIFFYLKVNGLGNWLNGVLLLGVLVCGELYFRVDKMGYTLKHAGFNQKTK